jgi:ATP-dependent DNA helicase RecQ
MGLDTLSTWGIMADTDAHRARVILDYLVDKGYLVMEGSEYPVLVLCAASEQILRSKEPLIMMVPREAEPPPSHKKAQGLAYARAALDLPPDDEALYIKLTRLRKKLAQEAHAPAYIIFPDSSLRDMCRKRPVTEGMFLEISGVGAVKNEKYGPLFTALIREYEEEIAVIGS